MHEFALLHFGEIGTKGQNRRAFEERLVTNVRRLLAPVAAADLRRESARVRLSLASIPEDRRDELLRLVALQPGIAWLSPAVRTAPDLDAICAAAAACAARRSGIFAVRARRADKRLPFDSPEIQRRAGAAIASATGRRVDLTSPDDTYVVEVDAKSAYVLDARIDGPDGLPVGMAGKVVSLLSGGLDSPVATWRMMVRGCEVVGLHLWNRGYSGEGVREKVLDLGRALARHQGRFRLVLVPFDDIQREIVAAAPADVRMLLYRRAMLRVAAEVKRASGSDGIVVGDSVSQVASQTLSNMASVYGAVEPPVLAPLHGSLKRDTIDLARRIGTFEISTRPGDDCCSLLVARHPRTTSDPAEIAAIESRYDLAALVTTACSQRETHDFAALVTEPRRDPAPSGSSLPS